MKTNKLNLLLILLTLGMFAFSSCEDEFTEEDFLKLQAELSQENAIEQLLLSAQLARANDSAMAALQHEINLAYDTYKKEENLEALRQAGLITSYTLKFENDGLPAAGVAITMTTSDAARTFEAVSAEDGVAMLTDVPVGTSVVKISGEGLIPMKGVVSFGALAAGVDYISGYNGSIYPLGRNESSVLEVFSSGSPSQMATITGRVTIETDLTNATTEIPQDITIKAILSNSGDIANNNVSPNVTVALSFDSNTIGVGAVDNATGEYSIPVPARKEGLAFDLSVPTIEAIQRLAITSRDGVQLAAPEYADVQTVFGPLSGGTDPVPNVPGARAVFTTPATPGTGVKTTAMTPIARPLVNGGSTFSFEGDNEDINFIGGMGTAMLMTSRGVYKTIPALTISGGGGSGATATATVKGYVTGLTVTNRGTGFGDSQPVSITIQAVDEASGTILTLFDVDVTSTTDGLLPATINIATASISNVTNGGQNKDNPFTFPAGIRNVTATVGGGAAITVAYTGYLTAVTVGNGGSNFNSLPVLAFAQATGTTGDTQAAVTFAAMELEYEFGIDNSEASDYPVLPAAFVFEIGDGFENGTITKDKTTDVDRYFQGYQETGNLIGMLRVSGGDVVPEALGSLFRVTSWGAPTVTVAPSEAITPIVFVNINNGAVSFLAVQNATFDGDANIGSSAVGRGYPAPIEVTIVPAIDGAPGAGASVELFDVIERSDKTYAWVDGNGDTFFNQNVISGGSGYLPNLNQAVSSGAGAASTNITVSPGDVAVRDYNFGTGNRKENVN